MKKSFKSFLILCLTFCVLYQYQSSTGTISNHEHVRALPNESIYIPKSPLFYSLDSFFRMRHKFGGFNGTVLVSKGNRVVYKGEFGYENFQSKDTLSASSSFQIASVSKTFTATAILYLVEKGWLSLEDTLGTFYPDFPYRNIKIKDLLCHRSGLPNYLHFCNALWKNKAAYMTNDDLIKILYKYPKIEGTTKPGTHFQYCNTNYALLASIVERVSAKRFPIFMKETFFVPLGMQNTFVFDILNPKDRSKAAISYTAQGTEHRDDSYDGIYGDKGIYSSTLDMYKWNLAFYDNKLISPEMQQEAYTPRSFEKGGDRNYGYGWRLMKQPNDEYLVYHNGWWHGNNTVFYRYVPDTFALIILSNRFNKSVYNVQPVFNIVGKTSAENTAFSEDI